MVHLDLCSGIGGFHLAAQWAGFQTVGFAEIEPFCCRLLEQKWPQIRNYGDLRYADFTGLRGTVTVLSAGVPCQPASLAGKRRGAGDNRWLWPAVCSVVESVQPAWTIFENPVGILTLDEFGGVLLRLAEIGYEVRVFSVPANAVGAKHRRQRVFIIANRNVERLERAEYVGERNVLDEQLVYLGGEALADANSAGRSQQRRPEPDGAQQSVAQRYLWRLTESPLCGGASRIRNRSHRLKALGNSVVPQQAYPFFEAIAQVER